MNIQPSLIVWTAICFFLAALILNKLLFKPMLAFMDERKARLDRAKAMEDEIAALDLKKEQNASCSDAAKRAQESFMQHQKQAMDAMKAAEEEALLARKKEIDDYKLQLDNEREQALIDLAGNLSQVSKLVADKLLD